MNILSYLKNKPYLSIFILVFIMLGYSISVLDLTIMEARNFITAREMLQDGNWLLTTMNGEARYQKPPLPTWLSAISASFFGIKSLFALRLPALLMVIVTGIGVYKLSEHLTLSKTQQFINALITITSLYVVIIIIEAPWDIYAHGFMLISIYFLFSLFNNPTLNYKHSVYVILGFAASILSKGPVSFFALLLPFLIAYGFTYKYKLTRQKGIALVVAIIFGIILGGSWYVYVRIADPNEFLAIAKRETSNWSSYNVKPFYYYWSFFTQSGLWTIPAFVSLLYPYLKSRVSNKKGYKFSFYWTIFAVILLSLIPEKKSRYLMPVLIPLAINTGFYIDYLIRKFKDLKRKERFIVYFNFEIIILVCVSLPIVGFVVLKDKADVNWVLFSISSIIFFATAFTLQLRLIKGDIKTVFTLSSIFFVLAFAFATPQIKAFKNIHYTNVADIKPTEEDLRLYSYGYVAPEVIWHYNDVIPNIVTLDSTYVFPKASKFALITSSSNPEKDVVINSKYTIEYVSDYDMNTAQPETRAHRSRLVNKYYILTAK